MQPRAVGLWMAATTAVSWAVLAIGLKVALQSFSSGTIVWFRMAVASAILLVIFSIKQPKGLKILKAPPWQGLVAGILLAVNYYGFMKGVELTTASNAQILIQLAPLSFAVISIYIYKEIPSRVQLAGMITALTGFGFFYWDQILMSVDHVEQFQTGNLWLLLAVGTWAAFALLQKSMFKKFAPQQLNLLFYLVAAVLLAPTSNPLEFSAVTWGSGLLMLFLAVNTVVGYGALSEALTRSPASHVSMIIAVNPLLTILLMTTLTQMEVEWIAPEQIHWRGFIGALFVVTGVILTVSRPVRLSRRKSPSTLNK